VVLEAVLSLAERHQVAAAQKLVDVRNKLLEAFEQIDFSLHNGRPTE
jgi:hypothetical protein